MNPAVLLIPAALCAELFAIWQLTRLPGGEVQVLLWHLVGSLLATGGIWGLLPARYRSPPVAVPVFLLLICLCLPLLGAAGLLLTLVPALRHPVVREQTAWEVVRVPDLPYKPLSIQTEHYGPGGLIGVLRNARDSERRLRAVIATRQMPQRAAVPILREALQDPVDDIRLLAYALLDDKQEVLTARIHELLRALEANPADRARGHARTAAAYWELAWLGLAEREVRVALLDSADRHLAEALSSTDDARELHFQRGRVRLLGGHLLAAERSLQRAIVAGMPRNEVMPYLAEVAFERHQFGLVSERLSGIDPVKLRDSRLAPVADYWL